MVTVLTRAEVSTQRIADMMVGAIEGGSNHWYSDIRLMSPGDVAPDDEFKGEIWYANPNRYDDPDLSIKVIEKSEWEDEAETDHFIGQKEIADGLRLMAEKSPSHFADLVNENDDAITADVFLQYVVFGQIVYG